MRNKATSHGGQTLKESRRFDLGESYERANS